MNNDKFYKLNSFLKENFKEKIYKVSLDGGLEKIMNNDKFYKLNSFLKENFKEKIYKVSLDGGFTCPNRDGKISNKGCIFCSDKGSGEFAGDRCKTITAQIDEQIDFMKDKIGSSKVIAYFQNFTNTYGDVEYLRKIYYEALNHEKVIGIAIAFMKDKIGSSKVIAYFQNFTNTYGDVEYLRKIYYEALNHEKVIGIAIATRPDCLSDDVINLLDEINKKYFLWVELGLQTANDSIGKIINRGYDTKVYINSCRILNEKNIKFVTHMIVGLPNEEKKDLYDTIDLINSVKSWGIKIHHKQC